MFLCLAWRRNYSHSPDSIFVARAQAFLNTGPPIKVFSLFKAGDAVAVLLFRQARAGLTVRWRRLGGGGDW